MRIGCEPRYIPVSRDASTETYSKYSGGSRASLAGPFARWQEGSRREMPWDGVKALAEKRAKDPEATRQAPWVVSREAWKEQRPRGCGLGRLDFGRCGRRRYRLRTETNSREPSCAFSTLSWSGALTEHLTEFSYAFSGLSEP